MNPILLKLAGHTLNAVIAQQREELSDMLAVLDGRVLAVEVSAPDLSLYAQVIAGSVHLSATEPAAPGVRLRGTPRQFMAMIRAQRSGAAIAAGTVELQGELGAAQAWQRLLGALQVDWEEWLANRIGDVPAHQLARALRGVSRWLVVSGRSVQQDVAEFVQHEANLVPTRVSVEAHYRDISTLGMDIDRAIARLERLRGRIGS